jgi:hypothetical protein
MQRDGIRQCSGDVCSLTPAQQRANAVARIRIWWLFGPVPSLTRIEEMLHWLDEQR